MTISPKTAIVTGITALIMLFIICIASLSLGSQLLGSDDGINLQAPYNIVKIGTYASFGVISNNGSDKIFTHTSQPDQLYHCQSR